MRADSLHYRLTPRKMMIETDPRRCRGVELSEGVGVGRGERAIQPERTHFFCGSVFS